MRNLLRLILLLCCASLWSQEVTGGTREIEFFAQGGHSVSGGRSDTTIFNGGVRYGFGLFDLGEGSFQYELEAIPLYIVAQPGSNAYGISFTPFDVKYNFRRDARGVIPFAELGGGIVLTNNDVPSGTNKVNFTPQLGIGVHLPIGSADYHTTLALKYIHISNAGLSVPNPGINTVQIRFGIGSFKE